MKNVITICFAMVMMSSVVFAGTSTSDETVNTIRDGEIVYRDGHYLAGEVIPKGYDVFGYNYHTHIFNGLYINFDLGGRHGLPPYEGDDQMYLERLVEEEFAIDLDAAQTLVEGLPYWPYRNDCLLMKWNDAWLSNEDKDLDGMLDRHWGYASYIGSGAWETNVQSGSYELEVNGEMTEIQWNYFCKIIKN
jgi:hypothetical protein